MGVEGKWDGRTKLMFDAGDPGRSEESLGDFHFSLVEICTSASPHTWAGGSGSGGRERVNIPTTMKREFWGQGRCEELGGFVLVKICTVF